MKLRSCKQANLYPREGQEVNKSNTTRGSSDCEREGDYCNLSITNAHRIPRDTLFNCTLNQTILRVRALFIQFANVFLVNRQGLCDFDQIFDELFAIKSAHSALIVMKPFKIINCNEHESSSHYRSNLSQETNGKKCFFTSRT